MSVQNAGVPETKLEAPYDTKLVVGSGITVTDLASGNGDTFAVDDAGNVSAAGSISAAGLANSGSHTLSTDADLTASTTQTQVGALALTKTVNEVATCANDHDAVRLPAAAAGLECIVINDGAKILDVFPATGDDAGGGANAAVSLNAGVSARYVAIDATTWVSV